MKINIILCRLFAKRLCFLICILMLVSCAHRPVAPPPQPFPEPAEHWPEQIQVALVLSGGGSRGLAHAGVLEVFEEYNIPIDLMVGSSAGSLVGVMYADDPNAERLRQKLITLKKWDLIDLNVLVGLKMLWELEGPVGGSAIRKFLEANLQHTKFQDLAIPLAIVATDIHTGEAVVLDNGPVIPAVRASTAVPMLFKPVKLYGKTLLDGSIVSPIPVDVARRACPKLVIAVDVGTSPDSGAVNTGYEAGVRAMHITYYQLAKYQGKQADILIHPEVDKYGMFEDRFNQEVYEAGRQAALKAMPEILARLGMEANNLTH